MLQKTFLHSGWEFAEKGWPGGKVATVSTGWLPAQVPGHVHLDLMANGIIADPFERMNELGCQWVDRADWSYKTSFEWAPKEGCPRRVLRFEGLDTVCSAFLNGELVAEHDNMFVPLEVDVTEKLIEGPNELRVDFQSAVRVGEERRAAYFEANGIAPDTLWFEERAFVRKAQYMFGWDWGPRLVSCGIWRPVCLIEFTARIIDVQVDAKREADGTIALNVKTEYEGDGVTPRHIYGDRQFLDGKHKIHNMVRDWTPGVMSFDEDDPASVGPITLGFISVLAHADDSVLRDLNEGKTPGWPTEDYPESYADDSYIWIGVSRPTLLQNHDAWGESFEFEVNGKKIWARGANWIPDHSFPSIIDKARLRDRLEKAKDMGFNMLRVWGGGLYETDEFYNLCDELGILVWQDFPFACSYYPDDEHWQEVIRKEAEVNIKRIRNHPCLALWCGNNENLEMHVNRWGGERQPPRYFGENHYDKVLPALVSELDPKTSYISTSPIGQPPEEQVKDQKRRGPNADGYGDQHNWDVWHGRGDWRHYTDSKGRFSSEYGFASSCSLSVWNKTLAEEDWDPHSPVVQWHDRTGKGHDTFHGFVKLHYPEPVTLEDWVYYSQLNQRDALRHGVEHYRRSEFCRGSLIWQLNDCWPVQSWSILDSDGNYKALAYELRRLHADVLVSLERQNENVKVWLVNHGAEADSGVVTVRAVHLGTGAVLRTWASEELESGSDSIQLALEFSVAGLAVPDTILFACFPDPLPCPSPSEGGGVPGAWQLLGEPKNSRFAEPEDLLFSTSEEGVLTLRLKAPVVDLMLTSEGDPSAFLDNFITSPGEQVRVRLAYMPEFIEARSLAGEHRVKVTRGQL
ncbi:MAG: glycoside hydrolase family 2 protein [Fimbriimonas sp.]